MSRLTRTSPLLPIGAADLVDADQRAEAFAQDQSIWEANRTSFGAGMSGFTTMELGRNIASSLYAVDPNWELTDVDLKGVTDGIDPDLWQFYDDAKSYKHLLYIYGRNQAVMDKRRTLAENGIRGFGGQLAAGLLDPGMLAAGAATGGLAGYIRGTGAAASAMRIGVGAAAGGVPQGALTAFQSSADPSISGKEVAKSFIGGAMFGGVSVGTATLGRGTRFLAGAAGQAAGPAAIDYATGTPLPDAMLELGTNLIFGGLFNSLHSSAAMKVAELPPDAPVVPDSPAPTKPPSYDPYAGVSPLTELLAKDDMKRLGIAVDPATAIQRPTTTADAPARVTLDDLLARPLRSTADESLGAVLAQGKGEKLPSVKTRDEWTEDMATRLKTAVSSLPDFAGEARAAADPITAMQDVLASEQFTDLQVLLAREDVQQLLRDEEPPAAAPAKQPGTVERMSLEDLLARGPEAQPSGGELLSGLLEGRFTTDPITPAAIQKMKPERRKRLAKATVAAAAAKPGGVDRLVKAIEKEAATKAIAATFDKAGRAMVGDAAVEAAAAEGRELTPAEKIRHAESVDDAKVEGRVSAALEAVGSTTPKPAAVEKPADPPIPQPESTFRAYRFTRNGLFDRLAQLWKESPAVQTAELVADMAFTGQTVDRLGSGDNPFIFKDKIPGEITQAFEGTRWMKHFRIAKPGETAGGADFLNDVGVDGLQRLLQERYGAEFDRWDADFRPKVMQWAKDKAHGNPEALFIAQILDNLSESKAKVFDKNVAFAAADDIQPGHEFEIGDTLYRVIEDEDGAKLIVDGPGFEPVDASALALIPYDRGSLRPTQISDNPFADVPDISPLSAAEATKLEGVYGSAEFVALVDPVEARRVLAEIEAGSPRVPAEPKPSTAKKLISAADKVIAKAKANKAQRAKDIAEAKKKAKPGQRLGIDEFTPSVVDNAMIIAAQAFKAGVRAVEQIRVMVRELLGADNPEVEARAMEILKASTNDAGQYDEALFAKQVENAFSTTEPAKESGATDAVANVPATRTYNLDAHRSMFASGVPESINQTAEIKILGKNRRVSWWRFDIAGMLGKSKSPLMRMAGKVLAFDFMPSKDGSPSVVGLHESVGHNVAANEYAYEEAVKPAWLAHREAAKKAGTKPMNREEFEIAAGKAFRRGEDPTDPNIRSVRSAVRKMYDDLGQMLKDHGLDVGLLDNYLNRMWIRPAMDDAALRMGRAGKDPKAFADGDRAAGYAQLRERFADAILAKGTITDRDEAIRLAQTIIDHAGHTDSYDGDDGVTTGYTSRLKERIDLDETYRWKLADGSEMGIEDLIESNLYTLFKNYNRAAHGSAALAEASRLFSAAPDLGTDRVNGIDSILTKIREDAMSVGLTAAEYSEDLDRVREALHLVAGLPSRTETGFTRMVDAVRSFQSFRLMANLGTGLLQVGEVIARTGELGPRVITNLFPAMREVITLARTGKMSSQQAREIAQMGIAVDRAASRIPRRAGESLGQPVGKSAAEWNLRRGARAAFDVAGISFLTDASRLAVMRTKQQQWAGWAYSGHLPSTRRLAIDTLSPEMAAKIVAEIRKPGRAAWVDKPGGLLDRYVWEKWPHDVRIAFQDSLRRNASRSILSVPDSAMPMVANSPVGKVFFQFRRMAVAAQATIGPELYARDGQMIRTLAASAAGGALIYIANTLLQSAGRRDRKAFLEERLEVDMVLRAAFSRSLYSAFVPTAIDTLVSDIGRQEPVFSFSRTTGLQGGFLLGNPTIDWFDRMGFPKDPLRVPRAMLAPGIPHYDFSRQDLRAIQGTLVPNIVGLKNALDRWAEGLPDTSYED